MRKVKGRFNLVYYLRIRSSFTLSPVTLIKRPMRNTFTGLKVPNFSPKKPSLGVDDFGNDNTILVVSREKKEEFRTVFYYVCVES